MNRLGSSARCLRAASSANKLARRAPSTILPLARCFASSNNGRKGDEDGQGESSYRKYLPYIGTGFAFGVVAVVSQRAVHADSAQLKCDGAPGLVAIETNGSPWTPFDAIEADNPENPMRIRMVTWVKQLQDHIVTTLEAIEAAHDPLPLPSSPISPTSRSSSTQSSPHAIDPTSFPSSTSPTPPKFLRDTWLRPEGGEGSSCVLSNGRVFEKAGVNVSVVHGSLPPAAQKQMRADHASLPLSDRSMPFFATGISIVIHPRNPHVPTVHLNYRYFELDRPGAAPGEEPLAWWFGGGSDLTPSYIDGGDITHFHQTLKDACDKHDTSYWKEFKPWCDRYFSIPHRGESRGVGGIFFDDLTTTSKIHAARAPSQEQIFDYVKDVSGAFLPAYAPIVWKNKDKPWTEEERRWQLLRRGRYVEFNLVYDRGTKFGLMTPGARIESILMSLPETARWEYMCEMGKEGTPEGELIEVLKKPREWA